VKTRSAWERRRPRLHARITYMFICNLLARFLRMQA
jgi:hypothetical protein